MKQSETAYALVQHVPSGEVYAIRHQQPGPITGICGPLAEEERDAAGIDYHFEDQLDDVEWALSIDNGDRPGESWRYLHSLPPA